MLRATEIGKMWQNQNIGSAICMSNAFYLFPGWSSITTALFSDIIACALFDLMLCSTVINSLVSLSAKHNTSISLLFFIPNNSNHSLQHLTLKLELKLNGFLSSRHFLLALKNLEMHSMGEAMHGNTEEVIFHQCNNTFSWVDELLVLDKM